ncbi:unnamed protein product [Phytomonas sp. Hart1]|nr:unnamed protein product [Phytomonas sp. Hart1]|eukprot:CCW68238.1 unnamed protein product [Phytomonas sp. isolate Hart1]
MFTKFLSTVKNISPRSTEWTDRFGPVALFGYDYGVPGSSAKLMDYFYHSPRDCDFYGELTFHDTTPIECPPETVIFLPVFKLGSMIEKDLTATPSRDEWFMASLEATAELLEKGYIPVSVGGDGSATHSMIEAHKRLFPQEDVVLIHLSAHPRVGDPNLPINIMLEKGLLKGVVSIANRCVSSADRRVRKHHKIIYMDMNGIYPKGIFCIRDIRNDYPVFISINVDTLDPAFAPAVENPVCGGLSTRDLLHIIGGIRGPKVAGIDIHGYNPFLDIYREDKIGLTQITTSKIIKESIFKSYSISTMTNEEGIARLKMLQHQGTLSENPYPDH